MLRYVHAYLGFFVGYISKHWWFITDEAAIIKLDHMLSMLRKVVEIQRGLL